jgi:hypothetical protein
MAKTGTNPDAQQQALVENTLYDLERGQHEPLK